jgi:uncharacterized protein YjbI with pentapeptide repeats
MGWFWFIVGVVASTDWYRVGLIALAVGIAVGVWWLWWRLPKREAGRLSLKVRDAKGREIRDVKGRADVEDNFRKTIGQLLGGLAVLFGTGSAYLEFSQQQRSSYEQFAQQQQASYRQFLQQQKTSQEQFSQQQQASHDLLISNQVSKGFEQLGSDKPVIQLGGIYALEGVMNTSDQYRQPILEALCAFVRDRTAAPMKDYERPATQVQAALTVIGRRLFPDAGRVDLSGAQIHKASLHGANLRGADLRGADLRGTDLRNANLSGAILLLADLDGAALGNANLSDAWLYEAKLASVDLRGADLRGAGLSVASLNGANLGGANLRGADLKQANVSNAELTEADLSGADLMLATIFQVQLDKACGVNATLPLGLTLKPCPVAE